MPAWAWGYWRSGSPANPPAARPPGTLGMRGRNAINVSDYLLTVRLLPWVLR